nr:MAG TPA: hypothetical protein [Caudoviricetes sp.]
MYLYVGGLMFHIGEYTTLYIQSLYFNRLYNRYISIV